MITRLEVKEFTNETDVVTEAGYKFSYFVDPKTGKYYRPKDTFFVTGEDLSDRFEEVTP